MPPKSLVVKLKVPVDKLQAIVGLTAPTSSQPAPASKPEKPKKEKKEKKPAEPKEPKPPREKKEPKKTKKQLQAEAEAAAAAATAGPSTADALSTPAPKGIKIKINLNKKAKAEEAAPTTPATAQAAAALSSQALTAAPTQAPQITSPRPAQLSNLPPLQTKVPDVASPATATTTPGMPKIRLKTSFKAAETPKTPVIKLKHAASKPATTTKRHVPIGYGYDSEASDREEDPSIEEQFILRMPPGEDADFLRNEVENKELGKATDVWFKFKDDRRAIVSVRGHMYAATLVDLPCIIESSKTIDKGKHIFKTADISQMLLVGDRLIFEDQALSNSVPPSLANYPHGITPPMHWARRRRFRKRVVNRNMDKVEEAVEKLLAADMEADKVTYDLLTEAELARQASVVSGDVDIEFGEEDAEGEVDDMEYEDGDEDAEAEGEEAHEGVMDLGDFEDQLAEAMMLDDEPAAAAHSHAKPPAPPVSSDEDEDDEDDDDDDDDGDEMDVDPGTTAEQLQLKEEIADIERAIAAKTKEKEGVHNQIVKQRIQNVIDGLRAELELKKASLEGT
ncbi:hypothetical protein ABW19_dt0201190 [Dactylella cylindrospora]|nr:hypothetical protein ABW19_dt0201190 [Dactylella cylindrospora]